MVLTCTRMLEIELMRCGHLSEYNFEDEATGPTKELNTYGVWQNEISPWLVTWITVRMVLPFTEIEKAMKTAGWGEVWYQEFSFEYVNFEMHVRQLRYMFGI